MQKQDHVARGIGAVRAYLEEQFPGFTVTVLEPSSQDFDGDVRRFRISDGTTHLLRASEEFLDLESREIEPSLRLWRVA